MAKLWKESHPIPWIVNEDEEDWFAAIGDYTIRLEQMHEYSWWWRVCYKGDPISTAYNEHASCVKNARNLAEGVYFGHMAAIKAQEQTYLYKLKENRK